jgi:hypothetical protein
MVIVPHHFQAAGFTTVIHGATWLPFSRAAWFPFRHVT